MKDKAYEIVSALNHNTLMCIDTISNETHIFFGKGLGFGKKCGEYFYCGDMVESSLRALNSKEIQQYQDLLHEVKDETLIEVVQEIVCMANYEFDYVNSSLNLTLLDHLYFAMERQKKNISINYPFLSEIKYIYPKEYDFSLRAFTYLNAQMGETQFDSSELGFIVLHIHAAIKDNKVSSVLENNLMMFDCTNKVEELIGRKIDRSSIYYTRFVKHLESAVSRVRNGIHLENIMADMIIEKCKDAYIISEEINWVLNDKYRLNLTVDELAYLTLHIHNIKL